MKSLSRLTSKLFKSASASPSKKNHVFSSDLDSVRGNEFVDTTIAYLSQPSITQLEGIFRIAGSAPKVAEMKKGWEEGTKTKYTNEDEPYDVGALFKLYFRELKPEPLLTFDMYESFVAAIQEKGKEKLLIAKLLGLLPIPNLLLLSKLMGFLRKIADCEWKNKMNCKNLAICFAPNLIYAKEETMETVIGDAMHTTNIIAMFIEEFNYFFKKTAQIIEENEDSSEEEDLEDYMDTDGKKKKMSKKQIKKLEEARQKKQFDEMERIRMEAEREREELERIKKERQERRRKLNDQWDTIQKQNAAEFEKKQNKSVKEIEEEKKKREEKKKIIRQNYTTISGVDDVGHAEQLRKQRQEARERREREMQERTKLKHEMEKNFKEKKNIQSKAQQRQRDTLISKGMSVEEFFWVQQGKYDKIKAGSYTYDDLLHWHNELERLKAEASKSASVHTVSSNVGEELKKSSFRHSTVIATSSSSPPPANTSPYLTPEKAKRPVSVALPSEKKKTRPVSVGFSSLKREQKDLP